MFNRFGLISKTVTYNVDCLPLCICGPKGAIQIRYYYIIDTWPAPMTLLVASRYVLPGSGYGDRWVWVQGPGWLDHLCQVIAAYALRLNGTEGSMVSSLNCDHSLILGLEALSH